MIIAAGGVVQLSSVRSQQRINQVGNDENELDQNGQPRESILPINQDNNENGNRDFELGNPNTNREMDIVEQLRAESIDLRINPVGMRRVLFRLKTDYSKVRLNQQRMAARHGHETSLTTSSECPVCLVNFENGDPVVPLTCNIDHVYHIECLLSWADHNYTCPICRQPIIASQDEINMYEVMQQRNQFNQHED